MLYRRPAGDCRRRVRDDYGRWSGIDRGRARGAHYADALFDGAVTPLANVASEIAPALGGHCRGHVTLRVLARSLKISAASLVRPNPSQRRFAPIRRWADGETTIDEESPREYVAHGRSV
jgi:hypothetical protein